MGTFLMNDLPRTDCDISEFPTKSVNLQFGMETERGAVDVHEPLVSGSYRALPRLGVHISRFPSHVSSGGTPMLSTCTSLFPTSRDPGLT